jgi:putative Ca2+/H+ antiporter (TMEM165/GDT1 family)
MPDLSLIATATAVVAVAEIGDKTQLLAVLLAARFRRPVAVIAGILVATLANHGLAAWAGSAIAGWLAGPWLQPALGAGFLVMALWALVPDRADGDGAASGATSAFLATLVAFFVAEMGDKTQIATVMLAARSGDVLAVTIGTTAGMLLANVPAVLAGDALLARVPLRLARRLAALLFVATGVAMLVPAVIRQY